MDTYNTKIEETGPTCPAQFFVNAPAEISRQDIIDNATLLADEARGVLAMIATNVEGGEFKSNAALVLGAMNALDSTLEQLSAVLNHDYLRSK